MNAVRLILSLAIVLIIGIAGSYFTSQSVKTWYPTLQKPFFTPPDWLFAPAWTTLYILIGLALYVCWQNSFWKNSRLRFYFFSQLALNFLWSPLFFGLQNPLLGLIDILALDIAVIATISLMLRHSKLATALMLPYLCWILFATALNLAVVILNT
ncbi:MAG: TspO/MBR family protein [Archaeoglobaceae archaeon]